VDILVAFHRGDHDFLLLAIRWNSQTQVNLMQQRLRLDPQLRASGLSVKRKLDTGEKMADV